MELDRGEEVMVHQDTNGYSCSASSSSSSAQVVLPAAAGEAETDFTRTARLCRLQQEFSHHQEGMARINHGSFGSCPISVQEVQRSWLQKCLSQPDEFYFGMLDEGLVEARTAVAKLVNAGSVEELVLVDNATVAATIVGVGITWSFLEGKYRPGDAILMLDCAYGAVKQAIKGYAVRAGAQVLEVKIPLPVFSPQQILNSVQSILEKAKADKMTVRVAVIDHVSSMPTLLLPAKELVRLCRRLGVAQVFVDGAHSIGSVDIDVQDIDADYYTSNLHKWLFAPWSAAFLHCKPQHLQRLHHPILSHNYGKGLAQECAWVGTRDYSALLAVPAAIDFVQTQVGGLDSLQRLNHERVIEMAKMLADAWGTHLGAPPDMYASMAMVALPPSVVVNSDDEALNLRVRLRQEFRVEVPIYFLSAAAAGQLLSGQCSNAVVTAYARISHQLYNATSDYYVLRDAINSISQEMSPAKSEVRYTA